VIKRYLRLLRANRNYRLLFIAQIVSELGDWFYTLAVYSLLLELTHSKAESVGLAVVLQLLPGTFVSPTAGVVNDRVSRKTIMIAADLARFFIVLGMLLVRTPGTVWIAYPLLLFETIAVSFFEPAHTAVIPSMVAVEDMLAANALASVAWSFCLAAGASIGGVVAALLGRDTVFILNAASFLVSAWLIAKLNFTEAHTEGFPPLRIAELFDYKPVLEGFEYIRHNKNLFAVVFVKLGGGIVGANLVLLPVLGERVFPVKLAHLDSARAAILGMSLLMGARGIGALAGPLIAGRWARDREPRLRNGILWGFLRGAAGYLCLGAAGAVALAAAAVALAHAGTSTNWVFSTTLLQIHSDDRFRGRVFAAEYGLCMIAMAASSYAASLAIDLGAAPRTCATAVGVAMLLPATLWLANGQVSTASRRP
jgi:MFS family permease